MPAGVLPCRMLFSGGIRRLRKWVAALRGSRQREQLYYLLGSAKPNADLEERLHWLENLMVWIRTSSPHQHGFDPGTGQLHNVRLRYLLHQLDRQPEQKLQVATTFRSLIRDTSARSLFSDVGLAHQKGFLAEAGGRLLTKVLPSPPQKEQLSEIFLRIFANAEDGVWVEHIPPALLKGLLEMIRTGLSEGVPAFRDWIDDIEDALLILGARVSALGTLPEVLSRVQVRKFENYPFLRLNHELMQLVEKTKEGFADEAIARRCLKEIVNCRREVESVYSALERAGVSVALVYSLETLTNSLERVAMLVRLLAPPNEQTPHLVVNFFASLVRTRLSQTSVRSLVAANLNLLSRKIVERAGATGEHYITRTRREYFAMLRDGLGGGAVMVFTTLAKFFLSSLKLPLLFEGLFFSINYSFSFVLLQTLGFTLATKQPSATASALAVKLRHMEEESEVREFVNELCRMTRTQFAAIVGNLITVPLGAVALDLALYFFTHEHFLTIKKARYTFHSLNPVESLTIFYAALTGVYLWLSSLAAGWFENWLVFRQIPEGLAHHPRLVRAFGPRGARKIGDWVLGNASLLGGNISLGFFLGFTASFGAFAGLPIDVRHVTLSAAQLAFAGCAFVGKTYPWEELAWPVAGVLLVGLINFAVGYSLSFAVAARARRVEPAVLRRLFRAARTRLRNRPRDFFLPPKKERA